MRSLVPLGLLLALWGATMGARQQAPTFRSSTSLVTIDVAVFDGAGTPVPGLAAQDFEVRLNGRTQPVRLVSWLEARSELQSSSGTPTPAAQAASASSFESSPRTAAVGRGEDRVFVLLFDDLSMDALRGRRMIDAAATFVRGLPSGDPIGLVRSSNVAASTNPTLDRTVILNRLAGLSGSAGDLSASRPQGPPAEQEAGPDGTVGVAQALDIDAGDAEALKTAIAQGCFNGDRTEVDSQVLDVLIAANSCASSVRQQARRTAAMARRQASLQIDAWSAVIRAMGVASGIRHLVIVSDGLPIGREGALLTPIARAAAEAGVQVSVLMEEPDASLSDEGRAAMPLGSTARPQNDTGAARRRTEDQRMYMAGLQTAASQAGGQFYRVVGDPAPFYNRVRTTSAAVYRLGVEIPEGQAPGRALTVEAKVLRPGVTVHVSRHTVVPPPRVEPPAAPTPAARARTPEERLSDALATGASIADLPLEVAALLRPASGTPDRLELVSHLRVAGPARGPVTMAYAVVAAGGTTPVSSGRVAVQAADGDGSWRLLTPIALPPGQYVLRVAALDAAGQLASSQVPVAAGLASFGPLRAGDVMLAWADENGRPTPWALGPMPSNATGVQATLELLPGATPPALDAMEVEFVLSREGEADPVDERTMTPQAEAGRWRAATEFGADDLRPGRYSLRVRVLVNGQAVGTVLAAFVR
jgi:VWFA-related protein